MNSSSTDQDIVLSSRIRLARNLKDVKFYPSLLEDEKRELNFKFSSFFSENTFFKDYSTIRINEIDELDRIVLKENRIISQRYYREGDGLVVTDDTQSVSIITGDLDHIRISAVVNGSNMDRALNLTTAVESALSQNFNFAFTDKKGYLTVNVFDSGTAMKGSLYLHLPVLDAFDLMDQYIINTLETMLEVTGFTGGGAHSLGGLYLISNKNSLFPDERSLVTLLNSTVSVFIDREREAREDLINGKYPQLEDKIFRSLGVLKYSRQISEIEAISALSMLRLGISVNWIKEFTFYDISKVFRTIGSGYLRSRAYEKNPDETAIMRLRSDTIRKNLNLEP